MILIWQLFGLVHSTPINCGFCQKCRWNAPFGSWGQIKWVTVCLLGNPQSAYSLLYSLIYIYKNNLHFFIENDRVGPKIMIIYNNEKHVILHDDFGTVQD